MTTRSGEARALLRGRLEARRAELEQTVLARVNSLADTGSGGDPEYVQGLRAAVVAALDYGFAGIEGRMERVAAVPPQLLVQARLAARNRVSLDTVLRRYFAGYTLLGDFLIEEVENGGLLEGAELKQLLRTQAIRFDRLVVAVSEEHSREATGRFDNSERRRAEQVERLLAGELVGTAEFAYEFNCWHLGVLASGPQAETGLRRLAAALDRRLLLIDRGEGMVWAWLGGREPLEREPLERHVRRLLPEQLTLAIGEPREGLSGWRLSHRQAAAALQVALLSSKRLTHYNEVALLASTIQDDLLVTSLHELYLKPLESERDSGAGAKKTLRAYFEADRNISSAAAALGMPRNTVASRLQAIEERLGHPFSTCGLELEVVIRLDDLTKQADTHVPRQFTGLRPA